MQLRRACCMCLSPGCRLPERDQVRVQWPAGDQQQRDLCSPHPLRPWQAAQVILRKPAVHAQRAPCCRWSKLQTAAESLPQVARKLQAMALTLWRTSAAEHLGTCSWCHYPHSKDAALS